jgi:hypothetical protein
MAQSAGLSIVMSLVVFVGIASAQPPETIVHEALRVEWDRAEVRPGVEGYVFNDSSYRIGLVRLRVITRDESGEAPGELLAWVYGDVPARGRCYFSVRVPKAREIVGITIESFKLIAREETPESP